LVLLQQFNTLLLLAADLAADTPVGLVVVVLVDIDPVSLAKCRAVVPAQNLRRR
jgi:hypothetical protein